MARKNQLRRRLQARLEGLEALREEDQSAVEVALSRRTVRAVRRSLAPKPIPPPQHVPWTCPRCDKLYRQRKQDAIRHATNDSCRPRRRGRAKPPKAPPQRQRVTGKHRRTTWHSNVRDILRKSNSISKRGCAVCRSCRRQALQCGRCYFLEWMSVAQDSKKWDELVYGATEGDGVVPRRRRNQRQQPEEPWEDPRPEEARRRGIRTLREVAAIKWPTLPQAVGAMRVLSARHPHVDVPRLCKACAAVLQHNPANESALTWLNRLSFNGYARAVLMEVVGATAAVV